MNEREAIFFTLGLINSEIESIRNTIQDSMTEPQPWVRSGMLHGALSWTLKDLIALKKKLMEVIE